MRNGFTLIELMIVIAIIAIIAAIAIPNLLESRVTAQESSAAAALKSGLLPAEVQFQAGGYSDADGNGIGTYCITGASGIPAASTPYAVLAGASPISAISLTLLAPSYGAASPIVSGYLFKQPITATAPVVATPTDGSGERTWAVITYPTDDTQGRRFFGINQAGNVYSSLPSATASSGATGLGGVNTSGTDMFGASLISAPLNTTYKPYRK